MTTTKQVPEMKRRKVTFMLESVEASEIFLSGVFRNWCLKAHPMKNDGDFR